MEIISTSLLLDYCSLCAPVRGAIIRASIEECFFTDQELYMYVLFLLVDQG